MFAANGSQQLAIGRVVVLVLSPELVMEACVLAVLTRLVAPYSACLVIAERSANTVDAP